MTGWKSSGLTRPQRRRCEPHGRKAVISGFRVDVIELDRLTTGRVLAQCLERSFHVALGKTVGEDTVSATPTWGGSMRTGTAPRQVTRNCALASSIAGTFFEKYLTFQWNLPYAFVPKTPTVRSMPISSAH